MSVSATSETMTSHGSNRAVASARIFRIHQHTRTIWIAVLEIPLAHLYPSSCILAYNFESKSFLIVFEMAYLIYFSLLTQTPPHCV